MAKSLCFNDIHPTGNKDKVWSPNILVRRKHKFSLEKHTLRLNVREINKKIPRNMNSKSKLTIQMKKQATIRKSQQNQKKTAQIRPIKTRMSTLEHKQTYFIFCNIWQNKGRPETMTKNISIILLICKKEPNRTSRNKLEIELKLDRANESQLHKELVNWMT